MACVTTSPTLLGPVLVWSQQNYLILLLIMRYFVSSYRVAAPATIPREKEGMKMNKKMNWISQQKSEKQSVQISVQNQIFPFIFATSAWNIKVNKRSSIYFCPTFKNFALVLEYHCWSTASRTCQYSKASLHLQTKSILKIFRKLLNSLWIFS